MLVGLISDSHDNVTDLYRVFQLFDRAQVELILHAGDIIAPGMCYTYQGCQGRLMMVYGNNDGDRLGIKRDFEAFGAQHLGDFGEVEAGDLKIALLHGIDEGVVKALSASGLYDVVVRGHNHRYNVEMGDTLVINPGEIWGHFTGRKNTAILDTTTRQVQKLDLGEVPSVRDIVSGMK